MSANKNLLTAIENKLSLHYNIAVHIVNASPVNGGDINACFHIQSNVGDFFLKTNNQPPHSSLFIKEYNGLLLLRKAKAITVPEPLWYDQYNGDYYLVTEFIERGKPVKDFWEKFALAMTTLHHSSQEKYGFAEDNFIGSLLQSNHEHSSWCEFYQEERLRPFIKLAADKKLLSVNEAKQFDLFLPKLQGILPEEQPALLHGDLWAGNFCVNKMGLPCIYDPAVYYGHREMDLAMARLFGGFDQAFFAYYNWYHPLQPGWEERVAIYQLYYLLIHLILFGGSYYRSVMDIVSTYL